ncbi:MAG: redoxin domain-containing protein [Saprospiraceae bacterium]|nr:redoxin domain-containing protein [Saprospiraceae bacterium]
MPKVVQPVPQALAAEVEAARAWFSKKEGTEFKVTGIVDPEKIATKESADASRVMQLILCGNQDGHDVCLRVPFTISHSGTRFEVQQLPDITPGVSSPAPLLDPPPQTRKGWLDRVMVKHDFIVLVFYRGFWCPPCRIELLSYQKNKIVTKIREAGGEIYAITSEPHTLALNANKEWGTHFDHIGDPHHEILADIHQRGWLPLFIWNYQPRFQEEIRKSLSHPNGIFQPGVLAVNQKGRILYRWRSIPNRRNIGGAACRVTAQHVWVNLEKALAQAQGTPNSPLDEEAVLDSQGYPFPLFLLILFASGWFLKPNFFTMATNNHSLGQIKKQLQIAKQRIILFFIFWIVAIIWFPAWLTALIFLIWIAIVTPQVYELYRSGKYNTVFGK